MIERNALFKEIKSLLNSESPDFENEFWDFDVYHFYKRISEPSPDESVARIEVAHRKIKEAIEQLKFGPINIAYGGYDENRALLKPGLNLDLKKYSHPTIELASGLTFFLNSDLSIGLNLDLDFQTPKVVIVISYLAFDNSIVHKNESLLFEMRNIIAHELSHKRHFSSTLRCYNNWLTSLTTQNKKILSDEIAAEQSRLEKISLKYQIQKRISPEKDAKNKILSASCINWVTKQFSDGKINHLEHAIITEILTRTTAKSDFTMVNSEILSSLRGFRAGFIKMAKYDLKPIAYQKMIGSLMAYPVGSGLWGSDSLSTHVKDWYGVLLRDFYFTRLNEVGRHKFDSAVDRYFRDKKIDKSDKSVVEFQSLVQGLRKQITPVKQTAGWKSFDSLIGWSDLSNVVRLFEDPSPILLITYPRINKIKSKLKSIIEFKDAKFFEENPRYGSGIFGATKKAQSKIYLRRIDSKYDRTYLFVVIHELLHFIASHPGKGDLSNISTFSPFINEGFTQYLTTMLLKAQGFNPYTPSNSYNDQLKLVTYLIKKYSLFNDFADAYFFKLIKAQELRKKIIFFIQRDFGIDISFALDEKSLRRGLFPLLFSKSAP